MVRKEFNRFLRERGTKKAVKSYANNNTHCPAQGASSHTTIQKVTKITKPQFKFFIWLIQRWWMLPVRYNFLTLSRYGGYSDRAIREQFSKPLPFVELFDALYRPL
jgi:hypothetical protein